MKIAIPSNGCKTKHLAFNISSNNKIQSRKQLFPTSVAFTARRPVCHFFCRIVTTINSHHSITKKLRRRRVRVQPDRLHAPNPQGTRSAGRKTGRAGADDSLTIFFPAYLPQKRSRPGCSLDTARSGIFWF